MAQKFLTDIELTRGLKDSSGDLGTSGQVLSSTGSGLNWITNQTGSTVIYQDGFTGNGSTTAFTLSNTIDNENKTQVYIDGVYQHKDTYSLSGTTLTFSTAPPNSSDIEIISFASVTSNTVDGTGTANDIAMWSDSDTLTDAPIAISGNNATFAGDISIPVAKKLYFGGGSHTYIGEDIDDRLRFFTGGTEFMRFTEDTSDTINFYTDANFSGHIILPDSKEIRFGTGTDANIRHDGNNTKFSHTGSGGLYIGADTIGLQSGDHTTSFLTVTSSGATFTGAAIVQGDDKSFVVKSANGTINATMGAASSSNVTRGMITVRDGGTTKIVLNGNDNSYFNGGNVGIATTSPNEKLEVNGNIQSLDTILLKNSSSGVKWQLYRDGNETLNFRYNNASSWSANAISIKNNNKVGIGTYEPEEKLDVSGSIIIDNNEFYKVEKTDGTNYKIAGLTSGNMIQIGAIDYTSAGTIFAGGDNISITTGGAAGSTRIKVLSSGNVGINTTTPAHKLSVLGDQLIFGDLLLEGSANSFRTISMNTSDGSDNQTLSLCGGATASSARGARVEIKGNETGGDVNIIAGNISTGDIDFYTANASRMIINNAGNVGIGTTSPAQKLEVVGSGFAYVRTRSTASSFTGFDIGQHTGGGIFLNNRDNTAITVMTHNTTHATFNADRTTTFAGNLHVDVINNAANSANIIYRSGTDTLVGGGSASRKVYIADDGNVGISVNPGAIVAGNVRLDVGTLGCGITSRQNHELNLTANADYGTYTTNNKPATRLTLTNTGEFHFGVDNGATRTAGNAITFVRALTILNDGKVGIGVTNPSSELTVDGLIELDESSGAHGFINTDGTNFEFDINRNPVTGGFTDSSKGHARIAMRAEDGGAGSRIIFSTAASANTVSTERMRIHANSRVSIGSTTASANTLTLSGTDTELDLANTSTNGKNYRIASTSSGVLEFIDKAANIERMRIHSDGKIGIGVSPTEILDVKATGGNTNIRIYDSSSNSEVGLKLQNDAKTWTLQNWGSGGDNLRLLNNAGNTVQIWDDNENVGIGITNDPKSRLHVKGVVATGAAIHDGNVAYSTTNFGAQDGGALHINWGLSGTTSSGDTITFTYAATSWKSWSLNYNFASTNGICKGVVGGYWNNSGGSSNHTETDNLGVSVAVTHTGQGNTVTFTFTALGTHPMAHFVYMQSGGDGQPIADRVTLNAAS